MKAGYKWGFSASVQLNSENQFRIEDNTHRALLVVAAFIFHLPIKWEFVSSACQ